jgi:hypothetical protein
MPPPMGIVMALPLQQIIIPEYHGFYWMGLFLNTSSDGGSQWAWVDPHVPGPEGYYAKWGTTADGLERPLSPPGPCVGGNWSVATLAKHGYLCPLKRALAQYPL